MAKLTLEGLEVLDAIDREGSFAAAAASLYRVPSKITYTVNRMEEELGVTLFSRQGRRAVLTPAGQLLLEQGREILRAAAQLVENARQAQHGWESRLRVAVDSVLGPEYLLPAISAFCELKTNTEVEITEEVLGGSWEALQCDRVDLVVGAPDRAPARAGISSRSMTPIHWVFAVAPGHPLTHGNGPVTEEERVRYRAIVVKDSSRELPAMTTRVFDRQQRIVVPNIGHKIAAQKAGLGVGFLPRALVDPMLASGELIEVPLAQPAEDTKAHIAWRRGNRGKALRWFSQWLSTPSQPGA